ncbi:uncharacterized protein [Typha latifolia]|uniref:uncharacterized protein n=1 Tax=Typha latifolia TaxID=4733 RepID=UPI003C2E5957
MAAAEERKKETEGEEMETVYKMKAVQFLGRSTAIVLQNDNGPCPLLAICNVLLLKNILNLSLDASEVSLQKLLSLVAERLIDSNSNIQDKDDGYVNNQQQNIADAIDLLPRLATGIDVNVHFRKINDFEFTRECAIFDLLDIPIYHGWIVDPQDSDTAAVIGSKSYNTLVAELVDFETRKLDVENNQTEEEDCVDFVAATTAALGVPSPCLSRGRSFDDCPVPDQKGRGDMEEEEELLRVLDITKDESPKAVNISETPAAAPSPSPVDEGNTGSQTSESVALADPLGSLGEAQSEELHQSNLFEPREQNASVNCNDGVVEHNCLLTQINTHNGINQLVSEGNADLLISNDSVRNIRTDGMQQLATSFLSTGGDGSDVSVTHKDSMIASGTDQSVSVMEDSSTSQTHLKVIDSSIESESAVFSTQAAPCDHSDVSGVVTPSFEGSEPIYEGEERILDSGLPRYEDREPVYEGEILLAEQAGKTEESSSHHGFKDEVASHHCEVIKNFLESNASQLTVYGLFCLQEGLKERELCVFFRNNHFSTMFKYNGELYLLATDQGYINQPDLVWEKLNEVNGDSVFMMGNFTEFKAETQGNDSWNEQHAMTSTADYLATLESSAPSSSNLNSDLQLAIALQQQEFEQQPQRQQQQHSQPASNVGRSRLVTGPQVHRNTTAPPKSESKSKEKCTLM